ncbi:MAG: TonB-dependent receptor [Chitinophagaceae bacterium]
MKLLLTGIALCCLPVLANAQHILKAAIKDKDNGTPLAGATVLWQQAQKSYIADSTGTVIITGIPDGSQSFIISYTGFHELVMQYNFPLANAAIFEWFPEPEEDEEEEVVVSATRTSRTIANTPTRVEVISGEELDEKGNMKPGDIRMLLNESTGIQTQQTSATSYNSSIRIQGLDGRYTQILRDGYPLYSGFAGGLSIMQVAPLDLKQVEVIKGSSSTLYGGGAIAGLVNLVSKTPGNKRELSFLANVTSAKGADISGFYSEQYGKAGVTMFASGNFASPYDPAGIGLTAIPKSERITVHPRLFLYGKKTTADIGFTLMKENRTGGSMDYIKHDKAGYYEYNKTDRFTTQIGIHHRIDEQSEVSFKNSYNRYNRVIEIPTYQFKGLQQSTFTELNWRHNGKQMQWIVGANVLTDQFKEEPYAGDTVRDYRYTTLGVFVQNTWSPVPALTIETGLRGDYVKAYGMELLPRASVLYRFSSKLTARAGGGFGYKTPTIFTEEAERIQFKDILPINQQTVSNERSMGANFDLNYRMNIGPVSCSINQLFFYTRLNRPLMLVPDGTKMVFENSAGHIDTRGLETNVKLTYQHFKLFLGYTYADVNNYVGSDKAWMPLSARHRLNNVLMYEIEDNLKLGLEAYYVSPQRLGDGAMGKQYWITGFMAEKFWEKFSVFVNFENFTDTRQTRFDTIYTGPVTNPVFRDIYAPVDGFVVNGGVKVRL